MMAKAELRLHHILRRRARLLRSASSPTGNGASVG